VEPKLGDARAWATVNKETGGGNKSGSGRGVGDTKVSSKAAAGSARRQGIREPVGGGAGARPKKGDCLTQATGNEEVGSAKEVGRA
jgi:hypothetical protein